MKHYLPQSDLSDRPFYPAPAPGSPGTSRGADGRLWRAGSSSAGWSGQWPASGAASIATSWTAGRACSAGETSGDSHG